MTRTRPSPPWAWVSGQEGSQATQLPALHQESGASQPRGSGAGEPLKSHVHGDLRGPLTLTAQCPGPTWTEHTAAALRSPQHVQAPAGPIHVLSRLTLTFWRRKRKLGVKELPLPQGRKQRPLPCPPAPFPPSSLGGQNRPRRLGEQHQLGGPHLAPVPACKSRFYGRIPRTRGASVMRGSHLTADTFQAAGTEQSTAWL